MLLLRIWLIQVSRMLRINKELMLKGLIWTLIYSPSMGISYDDVSTEQKAEAYDNTQDRSNLGMAKEQKKIKQAGKE
jgi:hypothetical protein